MWEKCCTVRNTLAKNIQLLCKIAILLILTLYCVLFVLYFNSITNSYDIVNKKDLTSESLGKMFKIPFKNQTEHKFSHSIFGLKKNNFSLNYSDYQSIFRNSS